MREDPNAVYDRRRCRTCGTIWSEHDGTSICARHRPFTAPGWVAEAVAGYAQARAATNGAIAPEVEAHS
jgi:hypothetical protein